MADTLSPLDLKQAVFLVVDDFEPMRKVTAGQVRSMGGRDILMANNGAEALRQLGKQRVDIVLSDWNMPVMTGLELLKAVRAEARLATLPFIMITAEAERHRIEEAIACGVSDLLVKPYTADRLATHIEKALSWRQHRSRLPIPATTAAAASAATVVAPPTVAATDAPQDEPAKEAQRPTILVVDDTADNLILLHNLFKEDYRVRLAHSGDKALGICQSNDPPDLVLLDIMMPGMDGFEVARRMREHPTSVAIPVIFVTAMTGADARLRGMELGAVDFVTKPINPDELRPRVRNFMRYVELNRQLQADYDGMLELARLREDVEHIARHDLKGPLAGVVGLVQMMEQDGAMNAGQLEQLHMIEDTTLQVLDMVNLSTELFKIETGRFTLDAKPVDIDLILRRSVEMARKTFAEKHIVIVHASDVAAGTPMPQALGDAMFCHSLFQNLIKNACEAAPERSQVTVTLHDAMPLCISITNRGAVPEAIRGRFFDKYVTQGKQGGTGLGTYSAKLLADAQNGSVMLDVSDPENLTTLTVTLPRHIGTPGAVPPAPTLAGRRR